MRADGSQDQRVNRRIKDNVVNTLDGVDDERVTRRDFLVLDPRSGDLAGRVESLELHGNGGPLTIDPAGNIHVAMFNSESNLVFDAKGTLVGGRYLSGTMQRMDIGRKVVWGDVFWPAPAFLPDGRGFTFWKDGLVELKVTLRLK